MLQWDPTGLYHQWQKLNVKMVGKSQTQATFHAHGVWGEVLQRTHKQHALNISRHLYMCHREIAFINSNQEQKGCHRATPGPYTGKLHLPSFYLPQQQMRGCVWKETLPFSPSFLRNCLFSVSVSVFVVGEGVGK